MVKVIILVKNIIIKPLELLVHAFFNFLERILYNSNSEIANDLSLIHDKSQNENGEMQLNQYLDELDYYYSCEIKKKYNGKKLISELQVRKNEIKNKMTFMSNVYLALGTGISAGIIANNIWKINIFFNFSATSISSTLMNLFLTLAYIMFLISFPILLMLFFKKASNFREPLQIAIEEFELNKINVLIDSELRSNFSKED